jgi:hypothetical protein
METPNDFLAPTPSTAMQNYGNVIDGPLSGQTTTPPNWLANLTQKFSGGTVRGSDRYYELLNQKNQQDFNSAESAKNRAFNLWTDSTRYQRTAEDLRKAGLNPLLLAEGKGVSAGGVSSSGSASSGTAQAVRSNGGQKTASIVKDLATTALALAKLAVFLG